MPDRNPTPTEHETLPAICGNILVESLQNMKHYLLYVGISWLKAYRTWNITCYIYFGISWLKAYRTWNITCYMWEYLLVESLQNTKHFPLFVGISCGWNGIEHGTLPAICGIFLGWKWTFSTLFLHFHRAWIGILILTNCVRVFSLSGHQEPFSKLAVTAFVFICSAGCHTFNSSCPVSEEHQHPRCL